MPYLTHWGRVMHICFGKLTIIDSDNGLSPERRQAIIWTNAGILLIGPLGTNFSEILIEIQTFSLKKIRLKMSSAKCCSFRLGLNVLTVFEPKWLSSHLKLQFIWSQVFYNTLRSRQNGRHFTDDIFKCIFLNEKDRIFYSNFIEICSQGSN